MSSKSTREPKANANNKMTPAEVMAVMDRLSVELTWDKREDLREARDTVAALVAENERLSAADDPQWDYTHGAHPEWWRGEQYGAESCIRAVSRVLDGLDDGVGVAREPWESVRRRLMALVERFNAVERERDALRDALKACAAVCSGDTMSKGELVAALEIARAALAGAGHE